MTIIMSSDLHKVLRELLPRESVWDAARRLGVFKQEKYQRPPLSKWLDGIDRIKDPIMLDATDKKYEKVFGGAPTAGAHRKNEDEEVEEKGLGDDLFYPCKSCWRKLTRWVFKEYGPLCAVCGTKDSVSAHHITPRDERGPNEVWNLMPLCSACHDYVECHDSKPRTREDCIFVGRGRINS